MIPLQRPIVLSQMASIRGDLSLAERLLGQNACAAETLRGGYDVQAGKVKAGDIRSILQCGKFLEDGVLFVPRHDEDDLQLVLGRGIQTLNGILKGSIAYERHNRPPPAGLLLCQSDSDRRGRAPSQPAAREGEIGLFQ